MPARLALQAMTSARTLRTLDFGAMMTVAYRMRRDEREVVARYLGRPDPEPGQALTVAQPGGLRAKGLEVRLHDLVADVLGGTPEFVARGRQRHAPLRGG